ncbi:MopE-related protein [Archangium gephyra]|uniref:MopE-related protein n=1 Tax=Archangium gephyra TaxID=48 RepID=UPI00064B39E6|nr:MopE-related protein [Archangium gephyra]
MSSCSGSEQQEASKQEGPSTELATKKQSLECNLGSMSLADVPSLQRLGSSACGTQMGSALSSGDTDGDGKSDILVGAPAGNGAACLVRGNGLLDIRTVHSKLTGDVSARAGSSVLLGNFNSSGKAELLAGGPGFNSRGAVYAVDGNKLPAFVGADVFKYVGAAAGDDTGTALATGDLTGDGASDLVVGAPLSENNGGAAVAPSNSGIVYVVKNTGAAVANTNLYTTPIYRIQNLAPVISQTDLKAGTSVAVADLNGDGKGDLLVGVPGFDTASIPDAGAVFVFYGPLTGNRSLGGADARLVGTSPDSLAGSSLARVGDLDGDGKDELLVGAPGRGSQPGRVYLVSGGSLSGTVTLGSSKTFVGQPGDLAGTSVASGDFDGDGKADLLVGAPGDSGSQGAAFLIYGSQTLMPTQNLSSFTTFAGELAGDQAGRAVSSAGDFDGDGVADILVGAPGYSGGQGQVYLIKGNGPRSWYPDHDEDGFGDSGAVAMLDCVPPSIGHWADKAGDCEDSNPAINPDAAELCSTVGIDDNCDGQADDSTASDAPLWFKDADHDLHADIFTSLEQSCSAPGADWSRNEDRLGDECFEPGADEDPDSNEHALEACDTKDNNCNGEVDEGDGAVWYVDVDHDGFGSDTEFFPYRAGCSSVPRPGYVSNRADCNDRDASLNPNTPWYVDADGDGVGNSTDPVVRSCTRPAKGSKGEYVRDGSDCNDADNTVRPGYAEVCEDENGPQKDNNCNGTPDDTLAAPTWFKDEDGDGFGSAAQLGRFCGKPSKSSKETGDCNDSQPLSYPGNTEVCEIAPGGDRYTYVEQIDNDCDGDVNDPESNRLLWHGDGDRDNHRGSVFALWRCTNPSDRPGDVRGKYLLEDKPEDCNDADAGATVVKQWYPDSDHDGCGDPGAPGISSCYNPSGVCGGGGTTYVNVTGAACPPKP